jgi:hypothetical protein
MAYITYNNVLASYTSGVGLTNSNPNALGGVRFSGTAGDRITATLTNQSVGTNTLSVVVCFKAPTVAADRGIWFIGPSATSVGIAKNIGMWVNSSSELIIYFRNDTSGAISVNARYSNFLQQYGGKIVQFIFVKNSSGNPTIYINGEDKTSGFSFGSGGGWTWQSELISTYFTVGTIVAGNDFNDDIYYATIYNFALSATEALRIYNTDGAIEPIYQWGSYANVLSLADSTFSSDTGFWFVAGGASFSNGNLNFNSSGTAYALNASLNGIRRYLITTVFASSGATLDLTDFNGTDYLLGSSGTVVSDIRRNTTGNFYLWNPSTTATISLDSISIVRLGAIAHYTFQGNLNDSSSNALNAASIGTIPFLNSSKRLFATSLSASNSTQLKRVRRIGQELDYYIQTGPKTSSINATVLPITGNNIQDFGSLLNLTGDSDGFTISVPNYTFQKSFLKSFSTSLEPWKPVSINLQFDSYGLSSGNGLSGFVPTPQEKSEIVLNSLRGTQISFATVNFTKSISEYESLNFDVDVERQPDLQIGSEYPTGVAVSKIVKRLTVNGVSNIDWLSDYQPNTTVNATITFSDGNSFSVAGVLSEQNISIDANGVAKGGLQIVEEMV